MFGINFLYNEDSLANHGMCIYDPDDEQGFIGRNLDTSEITANRPTQKIFSASYAGTLEVKFLIIKNEDLCDKKSDMELTGDDIHYLRSWLESPTIDELVVIQDDDDNLCTHYYGAFTDVQPFLVATRCYGLYLTFTCNAPYGFTDIYTYTWTQSDSSSLIVSNLSSEKYSYYKPVINIYSSDTFGNESIKITNENDNSNSMILTLPSGLSKITVDCEKEMIYDQNENIISLNDVGVVSPISDNYSFLSADAYFFYWLQLVPNVNKLYIIPSTGATVSKVEIIAQYPIKSGGY